MSLDLLLLLSIGAPVWTNVAEGVEYAVIDTLHMLRIDPERARVRALAASELGGGTRTAGQWCDERDLVAAINLGMFEGDYSTHTGFLRIGEHANSGRWVNRYG